MKENEDKTKITLYHVQQLYQTIADIVGDKYNVKIKAEVKEK